MTTNSVSNGAPINLGAIEALVKQGKAVISAEDSAVIELALKLIEEGKTATFYLKDVLFTEIIRRRNSTPDGAAASANLQPLSAEEAARIKADFSIEIDGGSSKETCPRCRSVYGTYEFIQQGIKEHGEEAVRAVFSLKGVSVLQIHPRQDILCQTCGLELTMFSARHSVAGDGPSLGGVAPAPALRQTLPFKIGPHSYLYRDWNHSYGCCR